MKTLLFAAAAAASLAAASAQAAARPEAVIKLEPYRKIVALRASINGHAGLFTFDSAGGSTLISPAFVKDAACTPFGRTGGYQMMGTRIDGPRCDNVTVDFGGGFKATAASAMVLDVAPLIAKDAAPVDGSIALDLFDGKAVTFDVSAGKLIVESPASLAERVKRARELPMRISRETQGTSVAVNLEAKTARGVVRFELDTGNGGTILVAAPYAELFGLRPDLKEPQQASFDVAPGVHVEGPAFAPDKMILDGNLGMPFLRQWAVTVDLRSGRLWLAPSGS